VSTEDGHHDPEAHVDVETLIELEERTLDAESRNRVLSHLETCGRCQAELALLWSYNRVPGDARLADGHSERLEASFRQKLREREELEGGRFPAHPRHRGLRLGPIRFPFSGRSLVVGGLAAASLALLVVGGYQTLQSPEMGELGQAFRSAGEESGHLTLRTEPTADGWNLSWARRGGVATYHVRVLTARGGTLLERDVEDTRLKIERSELTGAAPGELLLVQVEATDAQGSVVRSEPTRLP
jgi:hypothetical protein